MDRMSSLVITIASILCIWLGSCPVEGRTKCRGEWADHHACTGGNGKRSDSSGGLQDNANSILLNKLLMANSMPSSESAEYFDASMPDVQERAVYDGDSEGDSYDSGVGLENLLRRMIIHLQNKQRMTK